MNLIKIEWLKLKGHRFFWIGLGLFALLMIILLVKFGDINVFGQKPDEDSAQTNPFGQTFGQAGFYKLPYIWQNLTYLAGFFKFIPAFLMVFFIANEFQYRTLRQNIIDGLSVREFYLSKVSGLFIILLISVFTLGLTIAVLAIINNNLSESSLFENSLYLLAYFAEVLLFMSFSMFITLLFKRSAISIIVVLLYYFLVEQILGAVLGDPLRLYLPTYPGRELILQPFSRLLQVDSFIGIESPTSVSIKPLLLTFLYSLIYLLGGYAILKNRDL